MRERTALRVASEVSELDATSPCCTGYDSLPYGTLTNDRLQVHLGHEATARVFEHALGRAYVTGFRIDRESDSVLRYRIIFHRPSRDQVEALAVPGIIALDERFNPLLTMKEAPHCFFRGTGEVGYYGEIDLGSKGVAYILAYTNAETAFGSSRFQSSATTGLNGIGMTFDVDRQIPHSLTGPVEFWLKGTEEDRKFPKCALTVRSPMICQIIWRSKKSEPSWMLKCTTPTLRD
jgi:hypothetical protein